MSETHKYVMSISMTMAILIMLTTITFIFMVYTDMVICQKLCDLIENRVIEIISYAQFEGNVTVKLSLNEITSRPFEIYVINSSHMEVRVPLKYISNLAIKKYIVLPERVFFNYSGLIPSRFTLVFREINGKVFVSVKP